MYAAFDSFGQLETPYIVLCNPNKEELFAIGAVIYNTKVTRRFNALSEFEFDIPFTIDNGETKVEPYESIQAKKLVYVDKQGYFIIDNVEEKSNGQNGYKSVKCKSLEAEMLNKRFTAFKGTYKFFDIFSTSVTLMDKILELLPTWSAGNIDPSIAGKYRTFDITNSTVYGFLINDCEKAYGCVFDFDTVLKKINVMSVDTAISPTDIYFSYENLIKTSSFAEITDEIATALYVSGNGNLRIASVNPMGSNSIYNFSYYKNTDWMAQDLVDAITAWENVVLANQSGYASLLTDFRTQNGLLITYQGELSQLQLDYTAKEGEIKVAIQRGTSISALNTELIAIGNAIKAKQTQITNKQADIKYITDAMLVINNAVSFNTNFTEDQRKRLSEFIYENTYQNNTLVVTDLTTQVEYQDTAQELYDQAQTVLARTCLPRYEFKIDSANFTAMQEYFSFTNQLVLGHSVTVNVNDRFLIIPVLLEIVFSYDDPTKFSLTFSNRLRLDNGNYQYSDLMGQVVSTGSTVAGNAQQWGNWDENYKDTVSEFISSALDASKNAVINAANQEITIGANGLRGRTVDATVPSGYDDHQVWLTSSIMAFTKDNWNTASLAIGKIDYNSQELYGIVGDVIVGKILAGNQLQITNEGSNFVLDENGAVLNNASFTIQNTKNAIILTPKSTTVNGIVSTGISIQSKASGTWENVFYTDTEGNLILKGGVTAAFGEFGGWKINKDGISDKYGNYINSDGNVKLGGLHLTPGKATFQGDLYATNLYGRVVGAGNYVNGSITPAAVDYLSAASIKVGTMVADRIYSGIMRGPGGIEISLGGTPGEVHLKGDNGVSLETQSSPYGGIRVTKDYNTLIGPNYLSGLTQIQGPISVGSGATALDGVTQTYNINGQPMSFVNGILVNGGLFSVPPSGVPLSFSPNVFAPDGPTNGFCLHPTTLWNVSSGKVTKILFDIRWVFPDGAPMTPHIYGLNGGRVQTATMTKSGNHWIASFYGTGTTPVDVTGFEIAMTGGIPPSGGSGASPTAIISVYLLN